MSRSLEMYEEAKKYLVGGATTSGKIHGALGRPVYLARSEGSHLYDVDGNAYVDYHLSAGPILFGYKNPRINKAVQEAMDMGAFLFYDGQPSIDLGRELCKIFPSAEKVRLVNTGTEATLSAIRMARAYTGKDIVIRCDGHYHGMSEVTWFNHGLYGEPDEIGEVKVVPDGAGIPEAYCSVNKVAPFNDYEAMERIVERYKGKVAAVILEPVCFNCGCIPARKEYLQKLRELCTREGIVLIFDEVICGYRMRPGSAQAYFGVTPDMTTVGKAIGGGYPIAAVLGKDEFMSMASPVGKAGVSGTYSGNLVAIMAAIECAKMIQEPEFYDKIDETGNALFNGINDLMQKNGISGHLRGVGSRFAIFFGVENPEDSFDIRKVSKHYDWDTDAVFMRKMLEEGVYFHTYGRAPYPNHAGFGIAHSMEDINFTLEKADKVFKSMK